jgi:predicted dehydrogenase
VKILLVGLGRWGEKHVRVLRELGVELWVADVVPERRAWAVAHGVDATRAVEDFREVLEIVEAVDIVTPADNHLSLAAACLKVGAHCFIEKPLAMSASEGREIASAATDAARIVQVGHIFRFHPVTATLRDAVETGRIGAVRFARARFAGFKRPRTDVGVTHTDAIHYFDLLAHLLGRAATAVSAFQRDHLGRGLDDLSVTIVRYDDVTAIVEADYFVPGTHRECVIVGERGSIVADYGAGTVVLYPGEHRPRGTAWEAVDGKAEALPVAGDEPLRLELAAFLAACAGRGPTLVTAADGIHALEVVDAAAASARQRREVSLAELR